MRHISIGACTLALIVALSVPAVAEAQATSRPIAKAPERPFARRWALTVLERSLNTLARDVDGNHAARLLAPASSSPACEAAGAATSCCCGADGN